MIIDSEKQNDDVSTNFEVHNFEDIVSMQFSIRWDPEQLEFQNITGLNINGLANANFGQNQADNGVITLSWFDPNVTGISVNNGTSIFTLNFTSITSDDPYVEIVGFPVAIEVTDANGNLVELISNNEGTGSSQIFGKVFHDLNGNCILDSGEPALNDWILQATGVFDFWASAGFDGGYEMITLPGNYLLKLIPPNDLWEPCENDLFITLNDAGIETINFPVKSKIDCPFLEVDISTPLLRRCFENTYAVNYCNRGTQATEDASIEIEFDSFLEVSSSSIPWTTAIDNVYRFDINDIEVGECATFYVEVLVNCDAVLGQTHCVAAQIFPNDPCIPPNPFWDGSSLEVEAECTGDSLHFHINNKGADMGTPLEFIVIEDVMINMTSQDASPIFLAGQETHTVSFLANGSTFRMEVEQSPNHPGDSHPEASIEGCGLNGGGTFSTGFIAQFSQDDGNPYIDRDCQENVGSYDPNDKRGFPKGFCENHVIHPNTDLEYQIRFQNTGTDTAFNIVIKDTLSQYLNPITLRPGASSHSYDFELLGQGVVQFTFENIMLPDSNVNVQGSHGFVEFKIDQRPDLSFGTVLENEAAIFFDFNEPIITNKVIHTIGEGFIGAPGGNITISGTITKPDNSPVDSVLVFSSDNCPIYTNEDGFYNIIGLDTTQDLTIAPIKNTIARECITVLDMIKLSRVILGLSDFDHPYQFIAGDVNGSETITTFDLVNFRKFILGVTNDFPNNVPWRFVEKQAFETLPPNQWPSVFNINSLDQSLEIDWIAIATGDVISENLVPVSDIHPEFFLTDVISCSELVSMDLSVSEFEEVSGFQFSIRWDPTVLEFQSIENHINLPQNSYFFSPQAGILNLTAFLIDSLNISNGSNIFRLQFNAIGAPGSSTDISLNAVGMPFQVISDSCTLTQPVFHGGSVFLLDNQNFQANAQISTLDCYGSSNANIGLTVTGGTPPYHIEWSNGEIGEDIFDLPAGVYNCSISDVNGCQLFESFEISEPEPITIEDFGTVDASGSNQADGAIFINEVSGGTPSYSYVWSDGSNASFLANVPPGIYEVTITDGNGCQLTERFEIGFTTGISELEKQGVKITLNPNPVAQNQIPQLNFELKVSMELDIRVLSPTGKRLMSEMVNFSSGKAMYSLSQDFSKGLYFVEISSAQNATKVFKLIVL